MNKIYKLITNDIVFGEEISYDENYIRVKKPFSIYMTPSGQPSILPYDSQVVQGELSEITLMVKNVLYISDLPEMLNDVYTNATSSIVMPESKIII